MLLQAIAFYVFAAVVVASGAMVVVSRNPVYSVLFLILAFFNAAALFVLIGAAMLAEILFGLGVWGSGTSDTVQVFNRAGIPPATVDNTRAIGQVLYTQYFYLFQVAGLVLLVA